MALNLVLSSDQRPKFIGYCLADLYDFYGPETGFKVARKHISWYTKGLVGSAGFRKEMNVLPSIEQQMQAVNDFFCQLAAEHAHLKYNSEEALAA